MSVCGGEGAAGGLPGCRQLVVKSWQLAVRSWQLAVGSWQLELATGGWRLAVGCRQPRDTAECRLPDKQEIGTA